MENVTFGQSPNPSQINVRSRALEIRVEVPPNDPTAPACQNPHRAPKVYPQVTFGARTSPESCDSRIFACEFARRAEGYAVRHDGICSGRGHGLRTKKWEMGSILPNANRPAYGSTGRWKGENCFGAIVGWVFRPWRAGCWPPL